MATKGRIVIIVLSALLLLSLLGSLAWAVEVAPGVQVHGYFQNRAYFAPGASAQFRMERVSISTIAALPNNSTAYVEWYYHPSTSTNSASGTFYIESAYYETGAGDGRLRIGKGRRMTFGITPSYPNRKTSNYGIIAEAFTQDRIQGVQYMLQKKDLDLSASVHQGLRLGIRSIGEIPGDSKTRNTAHTVKHLAFREEVAGDATLPFSGSENRKLQFATRLGGKLSNSLKAGISYSYGKLDNADVANLGTSSATNVLSPSATPALIPGATSDRLQVTGLDCTWQHPKGFVAQGEWYDAKVSTKSFRGWDLLSGYQWGQGWKFWLRYGTITNDFTLTANPLTWDVKQLSISMVQPLRKGLWLQYEYEINTENTNTDSSVRDNLFFVELFTGF